MQTTMRGLRRYVFFPKSSQENFQLNQAQEVFYETLCGKEFKEPDDDTSCSIF